MTCAGDAGSEMCVCNAGTTGSLGNSCVNVTSTKVGAACTDGSGGECGAHATCSANNGTCECDANYYGVTGGDCYPGVGRPGGACKGTACDDPHAECSASTPPKICVCADNYFESAGVCAEKSKPGLTPLQLLSGVLLGVLLTWLLIATIVWLCLNLPCCYLAAKRRMKEEEDKRAGVSPDTRPPSTCTRVRNYIFCEGLSYLRHQKVIQTDGEVEQESSRNSSTDHLGTKLHGQLQASQHMPTIREQSQDSLDSPDESLDHHEVITPMGLMASHLHGFWNSDVTRSGHHSHDQHSCDQYAPLMIAVKKTIKHKKAQEADNRQGFDSHDPDQKANEPVQTVLHAMIN
ncbi:uncharacterized protein [Littorina saxatilis]|uniref:uncharacterized protein n=1 Tax=Littorina saxatilis TaxID=31220 RepID=UPI0038B44BD4